MTISKDILMDGVAVVDASVLVVALVLLVQVTASFINLIQEKAKKNPLM